MGANMRRSLTGLGACLPLSIALLTTGCGQHNGDGDTREAVERALVTAWATSSRTVDIDKIVRGNWTRLVFACAYTDRRLVERDLGFEWPEYRETNQDGAQTWIFATDDKVVKWAVINGPKGAPCGADAAHTEYVVPRHDARFRLVDAGYRRVLQREK